MNISFQSLYNGPALSKPAFGGNEAKTNVKSGSFTQNIVSKSKANLEELRKDDEKRYNALGAFLGISVLAGLGLALIYRDKVTNLFNIKKRRNIAKQMDVAAKRPHGGPEIDWSKGRRAIYESWEEYIQGIKDRRSQNHIKRNNGKYI